MLSKFKMIYIQCQTGLKPGKLGLTWEIGFNAKKCKSMHLGKNNPKTVYYMKDGDQTVPLQQVTEEKDLGVTFCEILEFDKHILNCVNKANKILGLVKHSFTYMDSKTRW